MDKKQSKNEILDILFGNKKAHNSEIPYRRITSFIYATAIAITSYLYINLYENYPHYINNRDDLDNFLGYENIDEKEVIKAILDNPNLPFSYKQFAIELIESELKFHPDSDMRIFYENIKNMKLELMDNEEFTKLYPNLLGIYDYEKNTIITTYNASREVILHELRHSYDNFLIRVDGKKYVVTTPKGYFLDEAMTNSAIKEITKTTTYIIEGRVLNYLMSFVDYTYEDYETKGIADLIIKLKEKYPEVKIDKLITKLDKLCESNNKKILSSDKEILDELFQICLMASTTTTKENKYEPLKEFSKLLAEENNLPLLVDYLNIYNESLLKKQYEIITSNDLDRFFNTYQDCTFFGYKENYIFPILVNQEIGYNLDTLKPFNKEDYKYIKIPNFEYIFKSCALQYYNELGTPIFWEHLNQEYQLLSPVNYKKVPIYYDNELLSKEYIKQLTLKISLDKNGKISYVIYKDKDKIFGLGILNPNTTREIPLIDYIGLYSYRNSLNLAEILNEEYLLERFKSNTIKLDLDYKDGKFIERDRYLIVLNSNPNLKYYLNHCAIIKENNKLKILFGNVDELLLNSNYNEEVYIDLKTVLTEMNIFNEEQEIYTFDVNYLKKLCETFLANNNARTRAR